MLLLLVENSGPNTTQEVTFFALVAASAVVTLLALRHDKRLRATVLTYHPDESTLLAFKPVRSALGRFSECTNVWLVTEGSLLEQVHIEIGKPRVIRTDVEVLALRGESEQFYFFPDRLLLCDDSSIGAVAYTSLLLTVTQTRAAEEGGYLSDAEVIGANWLHSNMDGTRDLRFKENHQIPIVRYERLNIATSAGFSRVIQFSKPGLASDLKRSIEQLRNEPILAADSRGAKFYFGFDKDHPEVAFQIASTEGALFKSKHSRLMLDAEGKGQPLTAAGKRSILIEAMVGTVLLGWRGLENQGVPFPYSDQSALQVLTQSEAILNFVYNEAQHREPRQ